MITKQELKEVLQKYQFDEKQIDRILNKRIKVLLKKGNKENIDAILEILIDKREISKEKIEGCLSVLATGKAKEIKDILDYLIDKREISKEKIEGCLYILARGKAKEIKEIFKYLIDERKIPQEKIRFFYNNMDNRYEYNISKETFDGQTMLEETKAILTILFRDYWATSKQKEKILAYENSAKNKLEEETRMKYNPDNLFKKKEDSKKHEEQIEETALVEYKDSIFKRIVNKILNILGWR